MFSIHALAKLQKYRSFILMGLCLLTIIIAIVLFFKIQHFLTEQKAIAKEKAVTTLRLQAIKAQSEGDLATADKLYTQALSEAETSGASMRSIEFLSRLAQIKIKNHKLGQAHDLAERAIKLAMSIKDTNASDSNLDVWMDDLANAFYKRGEHSTRDDVKKYCLEQYLEIKLSTEDKYDPLLISKAHIFNSACGDGNYLKLVHNNEKLLDYLQRVQPTGQKGMFLGLAISNLLAKQFAAAEFALKKGIQEDGINKSADDPRFYYYLGLIREEQGNLDEANNLYQKALNLQKECLKRSTAFNNIIYTGLYESALGSLKFRQGDLSGANQLLQTSFITFKKCPIPEVTPINKTMHPDGTVYSGQVFCLEHLAQIALKQGNIALANSLQNQAKSICAQNSYWLESKNPDPDRFYKISGFFPYSVDVIPTRLSLNDVTGN